MFHNIDFVYNVIIVIYKVNAFERISWYFENIGDKAYFLLFLNNKKQFQNASGVEIDLNIWSNKYFSSWKVSFFVCMLACLPLPWNLQINHLTFTTEIYMQFFIGHQMEQLVNMTPLPGLVSAKSPSYLPLYLRWRSDCRLQLTNDSLQFAILWHI